MMWESADVIDVAVVNLPTDPKPVSDFDDSDEDELPGFDPSAVVDADKASEEPAVVEEAVESAPEVEEPVLFADLPSWDELQEQVDNRAKVDALAQKLGIGV